MKLTSPSASEQLCANPLQEMCETDIESACALVAEAMNEAEAAWARRTFEFHFKCRAHGLDDGRQYFSCYVQQRMLALAGLHHYAWGPEENVWLAWFAVHPDYQRRGIGRRLLNSVQTLAKVRGFRKLFIETYDHPDFAKARQFYAACGFQQAGGIVGYLPGAEDMIVYMKPL